MTLEHNPQGLNIRQKGLPRTGEAVFGILSLFCFLLLLRNADAAILFFRQGLTLCARAVIPSLFPCLILAELIASSPPICRMLACTASPVERLFGLSKAGACTLLLGMLCGFPIAIRRACEAYRKGEISKQEAERIIALGSGPSAAFLIGTVGVALFEDRGFGVLLYAVLLGATLLIGFLMNRSNPNTDADRLTLNNSTSHVKIAKRLTDAVSGAVRSILLICAYVVFFGTLSGTLGLISEPLGLPKICSVLLFSCLELSGGVSHAATLQNPIVARVFAAVTVGWSGISVHCQALSFCDSTDLSLRPYLRVKLFTSLIAGGIVGAVEIGKTLLS